MPVSPSEFDITVQENTLLATGKAHKEEEKKNGNGYLHRGIARRAFERRFSLADHMKVRSQPLVRPAVPIRRPALRGDARSVTAASFGNSCTFKADYEAASA